MITIFGDLVIIKIYKMLITLYCTVQMNFEYVITLTN